MYAKIRCKVCEALAATPYFSGIMDIWLNNIQIHRGKWFIATSNRTAEGRGRSDKYSAPKR